MPKKRSTNKAIRGYVQGIPTDTCLLCSSPVTLLDVLGIPWCDRHAYRGACLNWGYAHRWPRLSCKPEEVFEISDFVEAWRLNMVFGDEYRTGFIAAYIDYLDQESASEDQDIPYEQGA